MTADAIRISHLIDELETIRTHPRRTFQNVTPLLDLAVEALAAGDLHIVAEFLDRVRTAIAKEDAWLRDQRK